jgi:hypothetical protein
LAPKRSREPTNHPQAEAKKSKDEVPDVFRADALESLLTAILAETGPVLESGENEGDPILVP